MMDERRHADFVNAWLERAVAPDSPDDLLRLFEAALGAVRDRTRTILGEVTLVAITERVLHIAAERFAPFGSMTVGPDGKVELGALRDQTATLRGAELRSAIRFVLTELLTVLGDLTAEILTDELHAVLSRIGRPGKAHTRKSSERRRRRSRKPEKEDKGS